MPEIRVLDSETIDKIAAGEVVERPSSVVKELVENALDAGADAITVEIRDGGVSLIRVTDNGCGMKESQVSKAFLRHATSKIREASDLARIESLGFRGEALSSIAAVSQVEIITKTKEDLTGVRYCIEGGVEQSIQEVGAPDGTTFVMRNLFYNVPVRKKFLKQAPTEGGYVTDLMEHLALSRPDVSFKFVIGSQMRFHTSGNGDLKEVIYRIYGREIANAIVPIDVTDGGIQVQGYLGKPVLVRSNRNYEIYFVNDRFVKSTVLAKAIEEGYKEYLMQHKFPFCVLHFTMDPGSVDVNVHPTKMDVRFSDNFEVTECVARAVKGVLSQKEMIPKETLSSAKEAAREEAKERAQLEKAHVSEPFEVSRRREDALREDTPYRTEVPQTKDFEKSAVWERVRAISKPATPKEEPIEERESKGGHAEAMEGTVEAKDDFFVETCEKGAEINGVSSAASQSEEPRDEESPDEGAETQKTAAQGEKPKQLNLFEEKILTQDHRSLYHIIGQVFDTYWMFEYEDKLCILDQHAAHEKVKYERFMKRYREKEILSQSLFPPVIVSLSGQEEAVLQECLPIFESLGFEIENFGGNEYALRSVPTDLYGCSEKEMFLEVLDELEAGGTRQNPKVVEEKIASMSCKAAVKGNTRLRFEEANELIGELLTMDNPYNCPHGRPTIITISKAEIE
ncbi:MAG: DNA mismatch repair endonuclease MutL, partial [Lachnospiraceae bacterium]|nr:DNA mismatch repair endonuclease MutL [Lachnospiraceae bacterium]